LDEKVLPLTGTGVTAPVEPDTLKKKTRTEAEAVVHIAVRISQGAEPPPAELTAQIRSHLPGPEVFGDPWMLGPLEEILLGPAVESSLQWLHDAGILAACLPEVEATVDFAQEMGRRHKDVWKHTKQVVAQSLLETGIRWAALLHDIGKVDTRAITPDGR